MVFKYFSIKRYLRRRMTPIDPHVAMEYKKNLAMIYGLVGWNIFGLVVFIIMKKHFPKDNNPAEYAKILGVKEAKVLTFQGFSKVDEYDLKIEDEPIDPSWTSEYDFSDDSKSKSFLLKTD